MSVEEALRPWRDEVSRQSDMTLNHILSTIQHRGAGFRFLFLLAYSHHYLKANPPTTSSQMPQELEDQIINVYHEEQPNGDHLGEVELETQGGSIPASWFLAHVYIKEGLSLEPLGIDWSTQLNFDNVDVRTYLRQYHTEHEISKSFVTHEPIDFSPVPRP